MKFTSNHINFLEIRFMRKILSALGMTMLLMVGPVHALEKKPTLSLEVAEVIANACLAHQQQTKYQPIQVVVVDDGGNTIVVKRQDGACKACNEIAVNKARTSALFNNPTRTFEKLSYGPKKDGVGADLPGIALVPGLIAFPGGLPIVVNGVPIGGVGVSGASGDEDEQCAQAGLDKAKSMLK
jgi:glc operon protein GlcG